MIDDLPRKDWDTTGFQENLLAWFKKKGRQFPWRETARPFSILVAEKLLQQTQVRDSVVATYQTLLSTYPTPVALAAAPLADLEAIVRPLGLTYRAGELKAMAVELVEHYDSAVPGDLSSLMALTGVGQYGARAVLSFAFSRDVAIVDTNVARIFYRVFGIPGQMPANPARKRSLIELATVLLPIGSSREFNFALLDLGALVCIARSPNCVACPVSRFCVYGERTLSETLDN